MSSSKELIEEVRKLPEKITKRGGYTCHIEDAVDLINKHIKPITAERLKKAHQNAMLIANLNSHNWVDQVFKAMEKELKDAI